MTKLVAKDLEVAKKKHEDKKHLTSQIMPALQETPESGSVPGASVSTEPSSGSDFLKIILKKVVKKH